MFNIPPLLPGFDINQASIALSITPALIIPADPNRAILYLQNLGTSNMFIQPDTPTVNSSHWSHTVTPQGNLRFTWELDGPLSTLGWWMWMQSSPGFTTWLAVRWFPERMRVD